MIFSSSSSIVYFFFFIKLFFRMLWLLTSSVLWHIYIYTYMILLKKISRFFLIIVQKFHLTKFVFHIRFVTFDSTWKSSDAEEQKKWRASGKITENIFLVYDGEWMWLNIFFSFVKMKKIVIDANCGPW